MSNWATVVEINLKSTIFFCRSPLASPHFLLGWRQIVILHIVHIDSMKMWLNIRNLDVILINIDKDLTYKKPGVLLLSWFHMIIT